MIDVKIISPQTVLENEKGHLGCLCIFKVFLFAWKEYYFAVLSFLSK